MPYGTRAGDGGNVGYRALQRCWQLPPPWALVQARARTHTHRLLCQVRSTRPHTLIVTVDALYESTNMNMAPYAPRPSKRMPSTVKPI